MAIKLIATDLDGTFLNSNHVTIPEENIEAFRKAHEMGVKVAVASGRTKILTDYLMEQLPFLDYLITSNGAVVYDLNEKKAISQTLIDSKSSVEIFDILDKRNLLYEIYFEGDCFMNSQSYANFNDKNVSPHIYALLRDFIKEVPTNRGLIGNKGIEKLNILTISAEDRVEVEKMASSLSEFSFASSFPMQKGKNGNLELTHKNGNKGFAVKSIADSMGITANEVMCFGDGENDCPMLEFAGYSFAMENGSNYAKNAAKYMADTNDNGGVAKAVKKYVFGE